MFKRVEVKITATNTYLYANSSFTCWLSRQICDRCRYISARQKGHFSRYLKCHWKRVQLLSLSLLHFLHEHLPLWINSKNGRTAQTELHSRNQTQVLSSSLSCFTAINPMTHSGFLVTGQDETEGLACCLAAALCETDRRQGQGAKDRENWLTTAERQKRQPHPVCPTVPVITLTLTCVCVLRRLKRGIH